MKTAQSRPTRTRWFVLGLVAFAAASAYLTRYCLAAANTTIQADLEFDDKMMGRLMSAFGLGYLLFQIPGGWLGNRLGTRWALASLSICWSLCNIWSGAASLLRVMWASRFSLGVFQAGLAPISGKIVKDWIPLKQRGLTSAVIAASMSIGGAFTLSLTGWLLARGCPWRIIFFGYSLVGIGWAVGFYLYFRTYPRNHPRVNQAELELIHPSGDRVGKPRVPTQDTPLPAVLQSILMSRDMWAICIQSFCRAAGYAFFVTWFFAFLEYVYKIDKSEAGLLNSLPLLAVVVGSLVGGVIVDWLLRSTGSKWISRSGTACVALGVCGFFTMASAWTSTATELSLVIAVGAIFSGIGNPAAWSATIDLGGRHTAVVLAVMNMAGCLAGVVLPIFLGNWFDEIKRSQGNWDHVIYLHAAFYFVGAVSWLAVNPNRQVLD